MHFAFYLSQVPLTTNMKCLACLMKKQFECGDSPLKWFYWRRSWKTRHVGSSHQYNKSWSEKKNVKTTTINYYCRVISTLMSIELLNWRGRVPGPKCSTHHRPFQDSKTGAVEASWKDWCSKNWNTQLQQHYQTPLYTPLKRRLLRMKLAYGRVWNFILNRRLLFTLFYVTAASFYVNM